MKNTAGLNPNKESSTFPYQSPQCYSGLHSTSEPCSPFTFLASLGAFPVWVLLRPRPWETFGETSPFTFTSGSTLLDGRPLTMVNILWIKKILSFSTEFKWYYEWRFDMSYSHILSQDVKMVLFLIFSYFTVKGGLLAFQVLHSTHHELHRWKCQTIIEILLHHTHDIPSTRRGGEQDDDCGEESLQRGWVHSWWKNACNMPNTIKSRWTFWT